MSAKSAIEWTDATWTPVRARVKADAAAIARAKGYTSLIQIAGKMAGHVGPHCEHASPGCDHCYSETSNARCLPHNGTGLPFDRRSRDLVDVFLDEKILEQPLHWRTPRRIFVCSQTDLFGEFVPDEMIDRVFAVMALCPQHTFQVLTKRADRMWAWAIDVVRCTGCANTVGMQHKPSCARQGVVTGASDYRDRPYRTWNGQPPPNVWLGVSVEDRDRLWRVAALRETPAAVRFLSVEPLLGDIGHIDLTGIDWVIVGGESGRDARPMHPAWARSIRDQCGAAGVPFFFKQWGEYRPVGCADIESGDWDGSIINEADEDKTVRVWLDGRVDDGNEFTSEAGAWFMEPVGKAKAGRLLDGRTWDEMPLVAMKEAVRA